MKRLMLHLLCLVGFVPLGPVVRAEDKPNSNPFEVIYHFPHDSKLPCCIHRQPPCGLVKIGDRIFGAATSGNGSLIFEMTESKDDSFHVVPRACFPGTARRLTQGDQSHLLVTVKLTDHSVVYSYKPDTSELTELVTIGQTTEGTALFDEGRIYVPLSNSVFVFTLGDSTRTPIPNKAFTGTAGLAGYAIFNKTLYGMAGSNDGNVKENLFSFPLSDLGKENPTCINEPTTWERDHGFRAEVEMIPHEGHLYGTCTAGGEHVDGDPKKSWGTLFRFRPGDKNVAVLHRFEQDSQRPTSIILDPENPNHLWGITAGPPEIQEIDNIAGTIYCIDIKNNSFAPKFKFERKSDERGNRNNFENGAAPNPGLLIDGDFLYGVTNGGGHNQAGVIFRYKIR